MIVTFTDGPLTTIIMARGVETMRAKGGGDDGKADQGSDDDDDDEMVETSITT